MRNFASNSNENEKELQDVKIVEQIVVTPFTISQDFNISEYKIKKVGAKQGSKADENSNPVSMRDVANKLPAVQDDPIRMSFASGKNLMMNEVKRIDVKNCKYDLKAYLGAENLERRAQRDNI